jgi:YD repeat-containing protein
VTSNGLNQLSGISSVIATGTVATPFTYDTRGNLSVQDSGTTAKNFAYSAENLLKTQTVNSLVTATLTYDPAMRLSQIIGAAGTTKFAYDGLDLTGEYNAAGIFQRRYVHGPDYGDVA